MGFTLLPCVCGVKFWHDSTLRLFHQRTAAFGPHVYNVSGDAVLARPLSGCLTEGASNLHSKIALISRGNCTFAEKVMSAQSAGAIGVIIGNTDDEDAWITMTADRLHNYTITIPSVVVQLRTFRFVEQLLIHDKSVKAILDSEGEYIPMTYSQSMVALACFLVLVPALWCLLASSTCFYKHIRSLCSRERRKKHMALLPIVAFIDNKQVELRLKPLNENCAVCLDDFAPGVPVKVLPCHHGFHPSCIDPWLVTSSELCPMCKQSVFHVPRQHASERWLV